MKWLWLILIFLAAPTQAQDCPGGPFSFYLQGAGGWISMTPNCPNHYAEGQTISLKAIPNDGKMFDHWEGDLSGTENPKDYTFQEEPYVKTFKAVFVDEIPKPAVPTGLRITAP